MNKNRAKQFKLVAACSVAIFSLAALIGGTYAWFMVTVQSTITAGEFAVVSSGDATLVSANLIKFDYDTATYGSGDYEFTAIDYLNPENGEVNKYGYNSTEGSFGYLDNQTWVSVDNMNTYDPFDSVIFDSDLIDLNCNAVYEFTVSSDSFTTAYLSSLVAKLNKTIENDELLLTSCVNFDIFTATDLLDSNPLFINGQDTKMYYPSYIDKSETMTTNEKIYYKISYLASLRQSHPHFYGSQNSVITLSSNTEVEFIYNQSEDTNFVTFYVNVDYAPSEIDYLSDQLYLGNVRAVYDFSFQFDFAKRETS